MDKVNNMPADGSKIYVRIKSEYFDGTTSTKDYAYNAYLTPIPGQGDKTPPSIHIINPANGAIVSGNVSISAYASDNVAVYTIDIFVDGTKIKNCLVDSVLILYLTSGNE